MFTRQLTHWSPRVARGKMKSALRILRETRGWSRETLAKMVKCHPSYINKLENSERQLKGEWLKKLSIALGVTPNDLLNITQSGDAIVTHAPIIGWASAGAPREAIEDEPQGFVPVNYNRKTVAAVKIEGTSINRVAQSGSYIVFDYEDKELIDKKYYLFLVDGDVTAKKYRCTDGPNRLEPDSTDPHHQTIYPKGTIHVIGRIISANKPL